jgi:AcrR family transcriptional regulator
MSAVAPGPARQQATADTRDRVVRAARAAFARQGYAGASMRRIAADAGLSAMALYTYAPSKEALFQLVYEDGIALIYAEYAAVVAGRHALLDEVHAILDRGGELLERDPDLLSFTLRVATDREHDDLRRLELLTGPYVEFFRELAERAVRRGEIDRCDTGRLVSFVTMLLWGITTATALDHGDVRQAVETAKWAAAGRLGDTTTRLRAAGGGTAAC